MTADLGSSRHRVSCEAHCRRAGGHFARSPIASYASVTKRGDLPPFACPPDRILITSFFFLSRFWPRTKRI